MGIRRNCPVISSSRLTYDGSYHCGWTVLHWKGELCGLSSIARGDPSTVARDKRARPLSVARIAHLDRGESV